GYAISQRQRKRTEEPFGWAKTIGGLARPRARTLEIQVHSDDGRLRPDPVAQLAPLVRMTSERSSKMASTPAKLDLTKGLNPWATAGHHMPSARISVACSPRACGEARAREALTFGKRIGKVLEGAGLR